MSKQLKYWKVSKYLDFITFLTLLLWVVLRQASFIVFPVSVLLLGVPLLFFLITIGYNLKLPAPDRLHSYRFAYKMYWHPFCNLSMLLAFLFIDLPKDSFISRMLGILGLILILLVCGWSFIAWLFKR